MTTPLVLRKPKPSLQAFNLVEVVVAMGISVFVLVVLLALYSMGIRVNHESAAQIQAGNLASLIISSRSASPTNLVNLSNLAIPAASLTGPFTNAYPHNQLTNYVGTDGMLTTAAQAAYIVSCQAGTNQVTGPYIAQVYLMLSWPVQVSQTNAVASDHYEITTYIPLR